MLITAKLNAPRWLSYYLDIAMLASVSSLIFSETETMASMRWRTRRKETWSSAAAYVAGKVRDAEQPVSVGVASKLSQSKYSTKAPAVVAHAVQRTHAQNTWSTQS